MAPNEKSVRLSEFKAWVSEHIKGDEKGEAQIYLDRLFKGFGHEGWAEAGATCEKRVKNDTGGTSFADLVWKPRVVIEMKKRGTDLSKHYSQAFTYWTYLVPNRPRYAVLCNFDEFWVYDFETQMETPVEKVALADLPDKYGALNFLFPGAVAPVFGNHHEEVTREAADKLATCFNSMTKRGVDRDLAQRFILQILMAFFAEDIDLLEKYLVRRLLDECKSPEDTYDIIGGLFEAMNRKEGNSGGRYKGVAYFNGGLFANPARVELDSEERSLLKEAARALQAVRTTALATMSGGLRSLYETIALPGKNPLKDAHANLDKAVLAAYGFTSKKDHLQQILDLNKSVAERIDAAAPVVGPGIPTDYPDPTALVSESAIGT